MIIGELVHNAVEHGLAAGGGTVQVQAERSVEGGEERLQVCVADDGQGLPEGFNPGRGGRGGLGTQIVTSLVQDLRGRITWEQGKPRGTVVRFVARLRPVADGDRQGRSPSG